jgi:superoxide dismutase, Fe-Mn family
MWANRTSVPTNVRPLLAMDVWEHAYYLDYQFDRERYIDAYLKHIANWDYAQKRYAG